MLNGRLVNEFECNDGEVEARLGGIVRAGKGWIAILFAYLMR